MLHEIVARPSLRLRALHWCNRVVLFVSTLFLGEWALYGVFRCPFVVPFVSCQNCPVITCPGQGGTNVLGFLGRVAGRLAVLFGKAFCGWLCPGHLVNRVLALNPVHFGSNPVGVANFRWAKYLALAACLTAWFALGQARVDVPIRVGEFWPSAWLTWKHAFPMWDLRLLITLGNVALGLVVLMCWCRFVCPFGAALELARKFSVLRFFRTEQCNDCDRCRQVCAMRTKA